MKAARLRVGFACLTGIALLAGVLLYPGTATADGDVLKAALEDYAASRYEEALGKLRAYVESNPDDEEVYGILREAEERVLLRALAKGGEHEKLVKYLLSKAQPAEKARMSDADEIGAKVQQAVTAQAIDVRRRAAVELRAAGELAVPHLYPHLASEDAGTVVNAILALRQLHDDATLPLTETLASDDARVRSYAAAVLGDIGDPRAGPALQALADGDADEGVRAKAAKALGKIGGPAMSAADQYVALGQRYYANDVALIASFDAVKNIWRWEDGALARYEVASYLYAFQMAEECAADALDLEPDNMGARSLLVRSLLAQKVEADVIAANGGEAPAALAGAFGLAASQSFAAATMALGACLEAEDWDVAVECCYLVAAVYANEDTHGHPLGQALVAPEKRVRYAAAISALRMSPKRGLPNSDKVSALAAQAASEGAIRQVLVIDDQEDTRSKLLMALAHGGYVAAGAPKGTFGVIRAKNAPTLDVIVVRADLGSGETIGSEWDKSSLMVVDELIADARTRDMRILILIGAMDASKADAIREHFQNKYQDKISGFVSAPIVESAVLSSVKAAAEADGLNADRERANTLAASAAGAFAEMDFSCASFDLSVAVEPLSTAATKGPTAAIRMNAVRALGNMRVGGADALLSVLTTGDSDELKAAAATALGAVLSKLDGTPEQIDALIGAARGDGDVAKAALGALGQVRNLTADQRRQVYKDHRLDVAKKGS